MLDAPDIFKAIQNGDEVAMLIELSKGVDINIVCDPTRRLTPLHPACLYGNVAMVKLLLEHNANTEARDGWERTALHRAAKKGIYSYNDQSDFIARRSKPEEIVKILLAKGANIDAVDVEKTTPLYIAVMNNEFAVVKALLAAGANTEIHNSIGNTCLSIAEANNYLTIVNAIQEEKQRREKELEWKNLLTTNYKKLAFNKTNIDKSAMCTKISHQNFFVSNAIVRARCPQLLSLCF